MKQGLNLKDLAALLKLMIWKQNLIDQISLSNSIPR